MADRDSISNSRTGSSRIRRSRGSSRVSSARSSAVFDEHLHPSQFSYGQPSSSGPQPHHTLRSAESRFSLHEQFATTRREYEFGDDDASSVLERATLASDLGDDPDRTVTLDNFVDIGASGRTLEFSEDDAAEQSPHEILCVRRDDLTIEEIRRAYWRAFLLLFPDGHPESARQAASKYFMRAQAAFEVLINPTRRTEYDLLLNGELPPVSDSTPEYEKALARGIQESLQRAVHTSSDLSVRVDASKLVRLDHGRRRGYGFRALDYTLSHSVTAPVPTLAVATEKWLRYIHDVVSSRIAPKTEKIPEIILGPGDPAAQERSFTVGVPSVTVSGSVYGLVEEMFLLPVSLLSDSYQPLLPLTIPRHRVIQLAENRLAPLVTVNYRQEIAHKLHPDGIWTQSAVELESDVLPSPCFTARASHTLIPKDAEPVRIETSITTSRYVSTRPRVGLGVHRKFGSGTAFARLDSGDWTLRPADTCKFFTQFSKVNRRFFYAEFPMKTTPSFEIGYKTTPCERGTAATFADSPRGESGMRGLDHELDFDGDGSWSVVTAMTADSAAGYVRYGRNLSIPATSSPMRLEMELCSNTILDRYIAVRSLFSVGRTSRLGLEVGVSEYNFHLSLYWSRLSQRIGIPFLISSRQHYSPAVLFWAGVVPFLAAAGARFFVSRRESGKRRLPPTVTKMSPEALAAYISRKRAEADELTVLMHPPVEARQKHEAAKGGLVIQSAKFGLRDGSGEDVADVTVALAALVEEGGLRIPARLRKGCLPGFWDPAPGREKVLKVRYVWRGKEGAAEVGSREELVLPPV